MRKSITSRPPRGSSKKQKKKKRNWWHWPWFVSVWSRVLLAVCLLTFIATSIVLIKAYHTFSRMIDRKISGEIFQNTAQVYATPLSLSPGQPIKPWDITTYLRRAGYSERNKGPAKIGEFQY